MPDAIERTVAFHALLFVLPDNQGDGLIGIVCRLRNGNQSGKRLHIQLEAAEIGLLPVGALVAISRAGTRIPVGFGRKQHIVGCLETIFLIELKHLLVIRLLQDLRRDIQIAEIILYPPLVADRERDGVPLLYLPPEIHHQDLFFPLKIQRLLPFLHLPDFQPRVQAEGKHLRCGKSRPLHPDNRTDRFGLLLHRNIVPVDHHLRHMDIFIVDACVQSAHLPLPENRTHMPVTRRPCQQEHAERKEQPRIMAPSGIRQPLEQEDRKKDETQTGKEIDRPVVQDQLQATEPDNRRFEQRQVIHHIIEQVIELILYIKQRQPDIP